MNPNVHMAAVPVGLLKGQASSIQRDLRVGERSRGSDCASRLTLSVEPCQLRLVRAPSRLRDQSRRARDAEEGKIGLGKVLNFVANGVGFTAKHVFSKIK